MLHKLLNNNFNDEVAHTTSIVEMPHKFAYKLLQNLNKPTKTK